MRAPVVLQPLAPPITRVALALLLLAGCDGVRALRDAVHPKTPHERYAESLQASGLDSTALGRDWIAAGERALRAPLPVALPFREAGYWGADEAFAVGYRFEARRGQRLVVDVETQMREPLRLFIDLFAIDGGSARPPERVASAPADSLHLEHEAERSGAFVLRLEPELLRSGRYTVTVRALPSLAFPVAGKDSRAVQSLFGAAREGGRRAHQGVDVFAPRGTPVVAATNGLVRSVGTNALGGRVVWLWDMRRMQSLYYAHLDSQIARAGEEVRTGDTLGLVGNTGNARATPPHLHFGIYRMGEGAVDPLPFIDQPRAPPPPVTADAGELGELVRARTTTALRASPGDTSRPLGQLPPDAVLRVMGISGEWYRVRVPDGRVGYVLARRTEQASAPVRVDRVARPSVVRETPTPLAVVMDTLPAGTTVPVLGRTRDFLLVRAPEGRLGWVSSAQ